MALATRLACSGVCAPSTTTSINFSAPSPSRATCLVNEAATSYKPCSNSTRSTGPASPPAITIAVSLVEVSVSIETQLNVRSMTRRKIGSRSPAVRRASVNINVIRVAMLGSIMPTPLATPTMRAAPTDVLATFETVSVVMMPVATRSASTDGNDAGMAARPARTRSIGYWRPITPVEAISTSPAVQPSAVATPATTSRALARPTSPVATLAFLEITTTACAVGDDRCSRLTRTLGPAKLLVVNTPTVGHGESVATTTKSSVESLIPTLAT